MSSVVLRSTPRPARIVVIQSEAIRLSRYISVCLESMAIFPTVRIADRREATARMSSSRSRRRRRRASSVAGSIGTSKGSISPILKTSKGAWVGSDTG